ncbi:MAG TPA: porin [Niastella sp.]|nr:porin [Niastella sp.]
MRSAILVTGLMLSLYSNAQVNPSSEGGTAPEPEKDALKFNLNQSGSHYFQFTLSNQTWLRFNESNAGTLVENRAKDNTVDIGLRRTRFQAFGQITDKVFVYFQFGMNNFNSQFNTGNNRKLHAFFHDALGEYKISKGNQLKVGGGLTIANGLSRFSQPSVSSIMTMDVPVFAQSTVDQTDEFSRKLSVYARGQVAKFDYRFILSDPFPITSSGAAQNGLSTNSNFAQFGHTLQQQGYLIYQFFEHENHTTPYMTGTYLGKKKIFNIAVGGIYQKDAMWRMEIPNPTDTIYEDLKLFALESFLDMPLSSKQDAISAYAGFFNTDYGKDYLRFNGSMNPANGTSLAAPNAITGHGATFGNAHPMFGTGKVIYTQVGYLFPEKFLNSQSRFMPYASFTHAKYDRLNGASMQIYNAGINCLINGHKSKFTLDWQNRPTYETSLATGIVKGARKNTVTLQYQIFF